MHFLKGRFTDEEVRQPIIGIVTFLARLAGELL